MNPEDQMTEKPLGAVKISGRVLHEVDHDPPSKCPDQDWWHLIETQVAQGAQSTCRATKEIGLWRSNACKQTIHPNGQPSQKR